ncbi:hypothetical protein BAUCODRAFT_331963 [Baudoinia panamericana UAMH 10762]|uniref:Uncharacterized protein n=1 Tax=Baudoinia panamericana (strain UAMH 10762) TaxID=717646 RepID=M2MXF8_BAUPA|nr:uncharacterized protein BAUCODRAFT_331963 [Baudoinia panamericana UAMH 10762]EMC90940.1 hypothetical protein BAUCODRAFT_331963 [Baudoinia panamericana UAMH 10762]
MEGIEEHRRENADMVNRVAGKEVKDDRFVGLLVRQTVGSPHRATFAVNVPERISL